MNLASLVEPFRAAIAQEFPTLHSFLSWAHEKGAKGDSNYHHYEPRRVVAPNGYLPHKFVAAGIYAHYEDVQLKLLTGEPVLPVEVGSTAVMHKVVNYGVPVYYVAEDFVRAASMTELPSDFTVAELHLPLPAMVLSMPVGFMKEYLGRDVGPIYVASMERNDEIKCKKFEFKPVFCPEGKISWKVYGYVNGMLESFTGNYQLNHKLSDAVASAEYFNYTNEPATDESDRQLVDKIGTLLLKLLLVLTTRPALVEPGQVTRPAKAKRGKIRAEICSPTFIGRAYRIARKGEGTHASPRWHWRRGHLTHQRIGSKNSPDFVRVAALPRTEKGEIDWQQVPEETRVKFWACHRRHWLEPMLVNLEEEAK